MSSENYNNIADDYNKISSLFTDYKNSKVTESIGYDALLTLLAKQSPQRVIDYGCGSGAFTSRIAASGLAADGIDISEEMIHIAQSTFPTLQFTTASQNNGFIELPRTTYDAITMNYVLCVIPTKKEIVDILTQSYETLKNDGKLYIQHANRDRGNGVAFTTYDLHHCKNLIDEAKLSVTLKIDPPLEITDYFISQETYRYILQRAGFKNIQVHELYGNPADGRDIESRISPLYIIEATK